MILIDNQLADLAELAWLPPIADSRVFGRDQSNPYYDFLYRLVIHLNAKRVLELGTYEGGSTSYLAAAPGSAQVVTVDIAHHPPALERLKQFPNVEPIQANTLDPDSIARLGSFAPFDLLFIDTLHEYDQVKAEFVGYRGFVRPGGVIVFDDISMNPGMARFWAEIDLPKRELNHLHKTGFGVVQIR